MKAKILENLGESEYLVQLLLDDSRYDALISDQQSIINTVTGLITEAEAEQADKLTALEEKAETHQDDNTLWLRASTLQNRFDGLQSATEARDAAAAYVADIESKIAIGGGQQSALEVDIAALQDDAALIDDEITALQDERDVLESELDDLVADQTVMQGLCRDYRGAYIDAALADDIADFFAEKTNYNIAALIAAIESDTARFSAAAEWQPGIYARLQNDMAAFAADVDYSSSIATISVHIDDDRARFSADNYNSQLACEAAVDYQAEIDEKQAEIDEKQAEIEQKQIDLEEKNGEIADAEAALSQLIIEISELSSELLAAEQRLATAEAALTDAQARFNAAFAAYNVALADIRGETIPLNPKGYQDRVDLHQGEAEKSLIEAQKAEADHTSARLKTQLLQAELKAAEDRLDALRDSNEPTELTCWTSAFDDSLEIDEEVEVVLIPGEPTSCVIHEAGITGDYLSPPEWQTAEQALYNYMILPGWQRHKYQYGVATVTGEADGDRLPIEYLDVPSSAQGLPTNRDDGPDLLEAGETAILSGFEEGDTVLIKYGADKTTVEGWFIEPRGLYIMFEYFDASLEGFGSAFFYVGDSAGTLSIAAENQRNRVKCWYKYPGQPWNAMLSDLDIFGHSTPGVFSVDDKGPFIEFAELNDPEFYGYPALVTLDCTLVAESGDWKVPTSVIEFYVTLDGKRVIHCAADVPGSSLTGLPFDLIEQSDPISVGTYKLSDPPGDA